MVEEAGPLKPYRHKGRNCCRTASSSSDEQDQTFFTRYNLEKYRGLDTILRLRNTKVHPLPPDLGLDPVVIDNDKVKVTLRTPYSSSRDEQKYQDALVKSWERTHELLGMDPKTPPPTHSENGYDQSRDDAYSKVAVFTGVHYLKAAKFLFIQPCQDIELRKTLFPAESSSAFDIVDDAGRVQMFVFETLKMLHRTGSRKGCCRWKICRKVTFRPIDRNIQPWEASFMGTDRAGLMHASRGNTHDVIITDFYNDIGYIIRTDTGRFPRHYNIVDARTSIKLCELGLPLAPDDEVLGNFDVFMEGNRIGKIRQGAWRFAMGYDQNRFRMRHGVHLNPNVHPELKAFILVAVVNAHFTFNVLKEVEDKANDDIERCNPDIWQSVFPVPELDDPYVKDHYYMDHALFFYHPWYEEPESVKRLSSTSLEIKADEFFSRYMEERIDFTYKSAKDNVVGLPYYKPMPHDERIRRNLFWIPSNEVNLTDQGYSDSVVPFNPDEVKEIVNRQKKNFKRRKDNTGELNPVAPHSTTR